jgi:hypothetical protein
MYYKETFRNTALTLDPKRVPWSPFMLIRPWDHSKYPPVGQRSSELHIVPAWCNSMQTFKKDAFKVFILTWENTDGKR